jgi:hypothetical protein
LLYSFFLCRHFLSQLSHFPFHSLSFPRPDCSHPLPPVAPRDRLSAATVEQPYSVAGQSSCVLFNRRVASRGAVHDAMWPRFDFRV